MRATVVTNMYEVYVDAKKFCKNIGLVYMSAEDVSTQQQKYEALWAGYKAAAGIQKARYVSVNSPIIITM